MGRPWSLRMVGDFGVGERAVEFFGAVVELGLEVGAEFGEDVVAGGGGEVVADGLEVAGEEVGVGLVGFMGFTSDRSAGGCC